MSVIESVAIVRFPQSGQAYQALSELRGPDAGLASLQVRSAALVERKPDGTLRVPEGSDEIIGTGTAAGGLLGMLAGVLGGPLGVLLGFGTGALVGGMFDLDRATTVDSALSLLSAQLPPGSTAQVAAEVEAAEAAAEAAQKEADRVLRERKRREARAKIDEKVDAVKEKLHHS
jgi:uncharacterized membrane protein